MAMLIGDSGSVTGLAIRVKADDSSFGVELECARVRYGSNGWINLPVRPLRDGTSTKFPAHAGE